MNQAFYFQVQVSKDIRIKVIKIDLRVRCLIYVLAV